MHRRCEVKEERGFQITYMLPETLPDFEYETSKMGGVRVSKSFVQINFIVEVEGDEIVVNQEGYSVGIWARVGEFEKLEMTEGMGGLVRKAFHEQKA